MGSALSSVSDALTLSVSRLAGRQIAIVDATIAILLAVAVDTAAKAAMAAYLGGKRTGATVGAGGAVAVIALAAVNILISPVDLAVWCRPGAGCVPDDDQYDRKVQGISTAAPVSSPLLGGGPTQGWPLPARAAKHEALASEPDLNARQSPNRLARHGRPWRRTACYKALQFLSKLHRKHERLRRAGG